MDDIISRVLVSIDLLVSRVQRDSRVGVGILIGCDALVFPYVGAIPRVVQNGTIDISSTQSESITNIVNKLHLFVTHIPFSWKRKSF